MIDCEYICHMILQKSCILTHSAASHCYFFILMMIYVLAAVA